MAFTTKKRLATSDDTLSGDAAQAVNTNLLTLDNTALYSKGAWSSATTYQINDVVTVAGTFYVATATNTNHTPPNVSYWQPLANPALFDAAGAAATAQAASLAKSGGSMTGAISVPDGIAINFGSASIVGDGTGGININSGGQTIQIDYNNNGFILPAGHAIYFGGAGSNSLIYGLSGGSVLTSNNKLDDASGNASFVGSITGSPTLSTVRGISINGTTVVATGTIGSFQIPANCTIKKWAVISTDGTSGSIAFDIQTCAIGSGVYTSTPANSVIGTTGSPVKPNLTSQITNSSTSFSSWTTTNLTAGNYLVFVVSGTPSVVMNVRIELTLAPR